MGQKVNPIGFRLPVTKDWKSRWFARKAQFGPLLQEDLRIREYLAEKLKDASVSRVNIERFGPRLRVTIYTSRPAIVVSGNFTRPTVREERPQRRFDAKKGAGLEILKNEMAQIAKEKEILLELKEVRTPEVDAQLVAENVAQQLVRRVAFRRAMKRAIQTAMERGADGIRIRCSGRLN
ncbi:MAG: 30S ribosomal protein S3, partial [Lentisphaerae bacterium]|nr:30S ribosomal protein S3 [Lentisphaerota bacterium]